MFAYNFILVFTNRNKLWHLSASGWWDIDSSFAARVACSSTLYSKNEITQDTLWNKLQFSTVKTQIHIKTTLLRLVNFPFVHSHYTDFHTRGQRKIYDQTLSILGRFTKLRKAAISFVMSVNFFPVHTSVSMEQFGSYWMDFHEIWYLSIFLKSVEKIQVLPK